MQRGVFMYCKKCGKQIDESKSFCGHCGAEVTGKPRFEEAGVISAPSSAKGKKANWKIIIPVIALLLVLLIVIASFVFKDKINEAKYRSLIESSTNAPIVEFMYNDYDRNGSSEAFVITGQCNESGEFVDSDIYYVNNSEVQLIRESERGYVNGIIETDDRIFVSVEIYGDDGSHTSDLLTTENDEPMESEESGKLSNVLDEDGNGIPEGTDPETGERVEIEIDIIVPITPIVPEETETNVPAGETDVVTENATEPEGTTIPGEATTAIGAEVPTVPGQTTSAEKPLKPVITKPGQPSTTKVPIRTTTKPQTTKKPEKTTAKPVSGNGEFLTPGSGDWNKCKRFLDMFYSNYNSSAGNATSMMYLNFLNAYITRKHYEDVFSSSTAEYFSGSDPLGKTTNGYIRYPAGNIDLIIREVFNTSPDRSRSSKQFYYHGDYFYWLSLGGNWEVDDYNLSYTQRSDGKYDVVMQGSSRTITATVALKNINGRRVWSVYSINNKFNY